MLNETMSWSGILSSDNLRNKAAEFAGTPVEEEKEVPKVLQDEVVAAFSPSIVDERTKPVVESVVEEEVVIPEAAPTPEPQPRVNPPADTTGDFLDEDEEKEAKKGNMRYSPTAGDERQGLSSLVSPDETGGTNTRSVQEAEDQWWYKPAVGLATGLRDFGLGFLKTGSLLSAGHAGLSTLYGTIDEEWKDKRDKRRRRQEALQLVNNGRISGDAAAKYEKTGNMAYLNPAPKGIDPIELMKLQQKDRELSQEWAIEQGKLNSATQKTINDGKEANRGNYSSAVSVSRKAEQLINDQNLPNVVGWFEGGLPEWATLGQENRDTLNNLKQYAIEAGLANREKLGPGPMTDADFKFLMQAFGINTTDSPEQIRSKLFQAKADADYTIHRLDEKYGFGADRAEYDKTRGSSSGSAYSSLWS